MDEEMSNPSKAKGTAGETAVLRLLDIAGLVRTPASSLYDLDLPTVAESAQTVIQALATRPDRGEWLITISIEDFKRLVLWSWEPLGLNIEVKRYARFSLHSIWNRTFRRKA